MRDGVVVPSVGGTLREDAKTHVGDVSVVDKWVILVGIIPVGQFQCVYNATRWATRGPTI